MQQIALEPTEKAAGKKRVCSRPTQSKLPVAGDVFRKENVSCFLLAQGTAFFTGYRMVKESLR